MGVEYRQHKYTCDMCGAEKEDMKLPYEWTYFTVARSGSPEGPFIVNTFNPATTVAPIHISMRGTQDSSLET